MAVVRKVSPRKDKKSEEVQKPDKDSGEIQHEESDKEKVVTTPKKRVCYFCRSKTEPKHWDVVILRKYINDRGRIMPHRRTGVCSTHQRRLTAKIKNARHLALLPFVVEV